MLLREYDCIIEVTELVDCDKEEMGRHKFVCYFMMNNSCIKEKNVFFVKPHEVMKSHLKPLFIKGKVEDTIVNNILVDGAAAVNLMSHFLLRKI